MKVIDKRTKNTSEHYDFGDVLKCWDDDPDDYTLYRISNYHKYTMASDSYIAAVMHNYDDNEAGVWPSSFDKAESLIESLKEYYKHVEKVNTYIVITD